LSGGKRPKKNESSVLVGLMLLMILKLQKHELGVEKITEGPMGFQTDKVGVLTEGFDTIEP
jgi:hypothetical protein